MRTPTKIILVVCLCALIVVPLVWHRLTPAKPVAGAAAVPVRVVTVQAQDVPRSLTAIGSALSLHSVTVRPQVDGILTRIAVKEGQRVKRGDLLATLDDRAIAASLEQARAQLAQSQAQLKVAQLDVKRYRLLGEDNSVSQQIRDQQQALAEQLQATVKGNLASVEAAQVQLSYTQIHSPVTGRVGIRNVDEGNFLRVSDTAGLFTVTQIDPIAVEFAVAQDQLPTLQALAHGDQAAPVQAFVGADVQTGTVLGEGHLTLIDNQVSTSTGTLRVKAEFDNTGQKLWPGQLVNVVLQTRVQQRALTVPPQVVQRGLDQHYVYRLKGDTVESVPVRVLFQNDRLDIIEGVAQGDVLVSDGQSRLKPGVRVEVLKSAMPVTDTVDEEPQP